MRISSPTTLRRQTSLVERSIRQPHILVDELQLEMITTHHPFFSVLTASYNRGATIGTTLESLSRQTFQDFQHIVVDGQSHDQTLDILNEFAGRYNLTWLSEPDRGIAHALNKGLMLCSGKYILVTQADDKLLSCDTLQNVYSILQNETYDIYGFSIILDSSNYGKRLHKPIQCLWWNHFKFIFLHQGTFVHKRVFQEIGDFNETFRIAMDYDFFYRALANHCSIKFESMPVALMGGDGIGSQIKSLNNRLNEEALVQDLNERDPIWRRAQAAFRKCYVPYKTLFLPLLNRLDQRRDPAQKASGEDPGESTE
jgi:glycosyltransferase involved in cell wall biosynthesis